MFATIIYNLTEDKGATHNGGRGGGRLPGLSGRELRMLSVVTGLLRLQLIVRHLNIAASPQVLLRLHDVK